MMVLMLGVLAVAQATVVRHALIVGSNDGGAALPQLRYAHSDAARIHDVLTELGGFAPESVTVLTEPGRDELLLALREHARRAEQEPEDLFIFYYSGHANANGLHLGDELLPYTELRQSINALESEVRLGVLDACRSGEITRLKGLSLSEPFATDDHLAASGEAWLTASSANEDAQESDNIQGSFFTHYLVSGLRGAADQDDGVVSLLEAYQYTHAQTVWRTGRTDGGAQHPTYKFDLHGAGDLPLTNTLDASAQVMIPAHQSGTFSILSLPDARPVAEVTRGSDEDSPTVIALPPGRYLIQKRTRDGLEEAEFGLSTGSQFLLPDDFQPIASIPTTRKGRPDSPLSEARAQLEEAFRRVTSAPQADLPALPENLPLVGGRCRVAGPACLEEGTERPDGLANLRFENGTVAASGEIREGNPHGPWRFFEQGGAPYAQGQYVDGIAVGEWHWWYPGGNLRRTGEMSNGARSGRWTEYYDDDSNTRRSMTIYANGSPSGRWVEWYPDGQKKSVGQLLGENRYDRWVTYFPDGSRQSTGHYDASGRRTGRWRTWAENGAIESRGSYWQDLKHGEWTFWWPTGRRAEQGHYNRGEREGRWQSYHPNGQRQSRGSYTADLKHGRWTEWYDNGDLQARSAYTYGEPAGRWVTVTPSGERNITHHSAMRFLPSPLAWLQ